MKEVESTEFQNRAGLYFDQDAKEPVFITLCNRPVRVLMDINKYERPKALDTRAILRDEDWNNDDTHAFAQQRDRNRLRFRFRKPLATCVKQSRHQSR